MSETVLAIIIFLVIMVGIPAFYLWAFLNDPGED